MNEVSRLTRPDIVSPPAAADGLETEIQDQAGYLLALIHGLTDPEAGSPLDHVELIHHLGSAAYHLAQARNLVTSRTVRTLSVMRVVGGAPAIDAAVDVATADVSETSELEAPADTAAEPEAVVASADDEAVAPSASEQTADDTEAVLGTTIEPVVEPEKPDAGSSADTAEEAAPIEWPPSDAVIESAAYHFRLTGRQTAMLRLICSQVRPGEIFKKSDIDLSSVEFISAGARDQAWMNFMASLVRHEVVRNLSRGAGSKYLFTEWFVGSLARKTEETPGAPTTPEVQQPAVEVEAAPEAAAPASEDTTTDEAAETISAEIREEQAAILAAARRQKAAEALGELFSKNNGRDPKLKAAIEAIMTATGFSEPEARGFISETGGYHTAKISGTPYLRIGAPEATPQTQAAAAPETPADPKAWTERDAEISYSALAMLVCLDDPTEGMSMHKLVGNLQTHYGARTTQQAIRKLANKGLITITETRPAKNGRPDSSQSDSIVRLQGGIRLQLMNESSKVKAKLNSFVQR